MPYYFPLDHHRGSEEQQPGQEYFDPDLLNEQTGLIDTLPLFRHTLAVFALENTVIPIVGRSETVGRVWQTPLSLIFIDGSHAYESVLKDYQIWSKHLMPGGYLVFHDIFPIRKRVDRRLTGFISLPLPPDNMKNCRFLCLWEY